MLRPQPYEFTHLLLPEEALLAPEVTWDILRGPDSASWLTNLWETAYQYANTDAAPIAPVGLYAEQCLAGAHEAVLINLPTPVESPEAWYALLVRTPAGPAPFRYFLLEVPADSAPSAAGQTGAPAPTLLTERLAETGTHRRHGAGPSAPTATTVARFLVAVGRLVSIPPSDKADDDLDDPIRQPTLT